MYSKMECVLKIKAKIGESPVWNVTEQKLYWVDIDNCTINCFDPVLGVNKQWEMKEKVGCIGLTKMPNKIIAAFETGYAIISLQDSTESTFYNLEDNIKYNRFNDGTCDHMGNFITGSMCILNHKSTQSGAVYSITSDLTAKKILDGFYTVNGLAFSPDGKKMYVSDSHHCVQTIWVYDYDLLDSIATNKKLFFKTNNISGRPDGGTIDVDGCYWFAAIEGSQIIRLTPDGKIDFTMKLPIKLPTKIAFGGSNLSTMYITSKSSGLNNLNKYSLDGCIFAIDLNFQGLPANLFNYNVKSS